MHPAREVGGDFYDFFFVDRDRIAMVIADVSGKGIPAALFMMRAKTAIRGLAEAGRDPAEILERANSMLCEGNEAEMFVTVWLGIADLRTGQVKCANAGHEYPAVMRAGGGYELLKDKHGLALAAMDGMKYKEYELQLNPGDRLFVYTDGVPEAINDAMEQYGTARMLRALDAAGDGTLQAALSAVQTDLAAYVGDRDQFDDITMLNFAYRGSGKAVDGTDTLKIEARTENLEQVLAFIERNLEAADCPVKAQTQICVAAEEIFVNIASYAYTPETGDAVISMSTGDGTAEIVFRDRGMPFDPLAKPDPDVTLAARDRQIGGLGIYMVKKSMDEVLYRYENGENVLTIRKNLR
jgi:sigma-B regulation protein RsbU (phosphoserine phosphatase)